MTNRNFISLAVLKTKRLELRQLETGDCNQIFKLRSDDYVNKYLERSPCKSIDDARSFIENILKNQSFYWGIVLKENKSLIGTICLFGLSEDNTKAEIGFELLPGFQGKGIMSEALFKVIDFGFHYIGLNSIEAFTHRENLSSMRILEKFNFKIVNNVSDNLNKYELLFESFLDSPIK